MSRPTWNDPAFSGGTMVRAALWLLEIGEGEIFTKEEVRQAFPGVSQADRRIRDLRDYGWVIHTSSDDVSLKLDEQRLVKAGVPVWEPEARRQAQTKAVTAKERMATFAADGYQCVVCGVAGGEEYLEDANTTAVLGITRRAVSHPGGRTSTQLVTECKRCRAGSDSGLAADTGRFIADVQALDEVDRSRLMRWIERDRRGPTPLDRIWSAYRRMPSESKAAVARMIR